MFKEDDEEVTEIMGRVCSYLTRVMFDDFAQSIKETSDTFEHLKENGFKKTLIVIPVEESK